MYINNKDVCLQRHWTMWGLNNWTRSPVAWSVHRRRQVWLWICWGLVALVLVLFSADVKADVAQGLLRRWRRSGCVARWETWCTPESLSCPSLQITWLKIKTMLFACYSASKLEYYIFWRTCEVAYQSQTGSDNHKALAREARSDRLLVLDCSGVQSFICSFFHTCSEFVVAILLFRLI